MPVATMPIAAALMALGTACGTVDPGTTDAIGQLDAVVFAASIQPILDTRGCSQAGCHYRDKNAPNSGGPGGSLRIFDCSGNTCTQEQVLANHESASGMANLANPTTSKLLTKPLALSAGGIQHLGGDIFPDVTDPDYVTVLTWIQNPT